jgi:hypothetical protein
MPLKLLHLGQDRGQLIHAVLVSLCERKQALSPQDRDALTTIVREQGAALLHDLPPAIPVRENLALVFGTLLRQLDADQVLPIALARFNSATDVLRLIAAYSGADPALQGQTVYRRVPVASLLAHKKYQHLAAHPQYWARVKEIELPVVFKRFKVAKLARPLRRALLAFMESLPPAQLTEDMLRHRSYWVWLGQFLHPHEYQQRFPHVARAFLIVRKQAPDGTPAPAFATYYARMEAAIRAHDGVQLARVLRERVGEFGRRLDLTLRLCPDDTHLKQVLEQFLPCTPQLSTPLLLTLRGQQIAYSSGDLTSAPYPDGASEFVDIDLAAAQAEGICYAVMVVNNYSGQAFENLERAFAGLMYRDEVKGLHFDPRTVALRFDLAGSNGVFLPMVLDFSRQKMHWLDAYSTGEFEFNNVASSNSAITTLCPAMIDYFASGVRPSMFDLALLHAAARGGKVWLRGPDLVLLERHEGESASAFLSRLRSRQGQSQPQMPFDSDSPVWAALNHGDLDLPEGSTCYALQPQTMRPGMTAADLLS